MLSFVRVVRRSQTRASCAGRMEMCSVSPSACLDSCSPDFGAKRREHFFLFFCINFFVSIYLSPQTWQNVTVMTAGSANWHELTRAFGLRSSGVNSQLWDAGGQSRCNAQGQFYLAALFNIFCIQGDRTRCPSLTQVCVQSGSNFVRTTDGQACRFQPLACAPRPLFVPWQSCTAWAQQTSNTHARTHKCMQHIMPASISAKNHRGRE